MSAGGKFLTWLGALLALAAAWALLTYGVLSSTTDEDARVLVAALSPMLGGVIGIAGSALLVERLSREV
jgi:hypothetical protein